MGVSYNKSRNNWMAYVNNKFKRYFIGGYKSEIDSARAHDLYILIHLPNEHYKLNFEWSDKDIEKWKTKLHSARRPNLWIPKTSDETAKAELSRIIDAINNNKFLLAEKLVDILNKKNKSNTNAQMKELVIV